MDVYTGEGQHGQEATMDTAASWIWPARHDGPNLYVQFRQEFWLEHVDPASNIKLCADTAYALWLNSHFVHSGQFHDWPGQKTHDTLDLAEFLEPGRNVLCLLVYHQGVGSAQYIPSRPGITYIIASANRTVTSGLDTYWRRDPGYRNEGLDRITPQLHFAFEYDSHPGDDWLDPEYVPDSRWQRIDMQDLSTVDWHACRPRPVKRTLVKNRLPTRIMTQGFFKYADINEPLARRMQHAYLSNRSAHEIFDTGADTFPVKIKTQSHDVDGVFIIIDLGREEAGLFEIEIDSGAGTIVDIAYGEHLEDLRVRASIGVRSFANRYITRQGHQVFTHYFTRLAGRYIQLHISASSSVSTLQYAGLRCVEYPVIEKSFFSSCCHLQDAIYRTAVRTLHLSMHEHYEDSPWREQALYANDARNQALSGYYCFGEYDFPAASLDLLGKGLRPDGFLELCAPAELPITIPSFSLVWVLAVADHLFYSGDERSATDRLAVVKKILDSRLEEMVDGLLPCPEGPRYWQFYDWANGLDGTIQGDCTRYEVVRGKRFDAPLNLFLCLALESGAAIAGHCGDNGYAMQIRYYAENLRKNIRDRFFTPENGLFQSYIDDTGLLGHQAELTQALAILADVASDGEADFLRHHLANDHNNLVKTTLSQSLYKFEALLADKSNYGSYVFEKVNTDWGGMLFHGATSFWETLGGSSDFNNAGSLCHGWSAVPVYLYYAHLMGIKPLEPGFRKFVVDPSALAIDRNSARIATPAGIITLQVRRLEGRLVGRLEHPGQLVPVFPGQNAEDEIIVRSY